MKPLTRPICFYDIEGTGTDPVTDHILTLAMAKVDPDLTIIDRYYGEFNGRGKQMTQETIDVHGITNEKAATFPKWTKERALEIVKFLDGCDIAGFNSTNYDATMLWEELHREGVDWDFQKCHHIDVGSLFKIHERRTLEAAVMFYCKRKHENAHNSMGDVEATIDVFRAQLARYPDLDDMDAAALAKHSQYDEPRLDVAGKIVLNKDGIPVYNFGKNKGTPVKDDVGFGEWILGKDFSQNTKQVIRNLIYGPPIDAGEPEDFEYTFGTGDLVNQA